MVVRIYSLAIVLLAASCCTEPEPAPPPSPRPTPEKVIDLFKEQGSALNPDQSALYERIKDAPSTVRLQAFEFVASDSVLAALDDGETALRFRLPETDAVVAAPVSRRKRVDNSLIWTGETVGVNGSVSFMTRDDRVTGEVRIPGKVYAIQPLGGGAHVIIETRMEKKEHSDSFNDKASRKEPPVRKVPDRKENENLPTPASYESLSSGAHPHYEIGLVVAYTPEAAAYYRDIVWEKIEWAIELTNEALAFSEITNLTVRLAYAYPTVSQYGSNWDGFLDAFVDDDDTVMDDIHGLRTQYGGDIAVLMVHNDDLPTTGGDVLCGEVHRIYAAADEAFFMVDHVCSTRDYSLAHEIGHIFGALHHRATSPGDWPFEYGHGYVVDGLFRTIMATWFYGSPDRVHHWSSPDVYHAGYMTGTAQWEDNARVMEERASDVASFR